MLGWKVSEPDWSHLCDRSSMCNASHLWSFYKEVKHCDEDQGSKTLYLKKRNLIQSRCVRWTLSDILVLVFLQLVQNKYINKSTYFTVLYQQVNDKILIKTAALNRQTSQRELFLFSEVFLELFHHQLQLVLIVFQLWAAPHQEFNNNTFKKG